MAEAIAVLETSQQPAKHQTTYFPTIKRGQTQRNPRVLSN